MEGGDGQCGDLFMESLMGVQKGNAEGMNGGESLLAPVRSRRSQVTQVMGLVVQTYLRFVPRPRGASG